MKQYDGVVEFETRLEIQAIYLALEQWQRENTNADERVQSEVAQLVDFLVKLDLCW